MVDDRIYPIISGLKEDCLKLRQLKYRDGYKLLCLQSKKPFADITYFVKDFILKEFGKLSDIKAKIAIIILLLVNTELNFLFNSQVLTNILLFRCD